MPLRVLVLGGGFAGLRAAVSLTDAGVKVTVVEGRASLGGRARSFIDPATREVVDNGQHLFLSGYQRTLAFLKRLGREDQVTFQPRLQIRFVEASGRSFQLKAAPLPSPWHLLWGMGRFPAFTFRDKRNLLWIRAALAAATDGAESGETVQAWLGRMGQSEQAIQKFWRPLTVAALNEEPGTAAAEGLISVLQVVLFRSAGESRLGMARVGLNDLYANSSRRIVEEAGGVVLLNQTATQLLSREGKIDAVRLADGSCLESDGVVSTLPPWALVRILPQPEGKELAERLMVFRSSPIVSVNLWLDPPLKFHEPFVALLGTRFQWVFNKAAILGEAGVPAQYLALILSAAHAEMEWTSQELSDLAWADLIACFPEARSRRLLRSQVVRERDATVSLDVEAQRRRPGHRSGLAGLFLAGDWTATGLPATIESAVVSGERCAQEVLKGLASSSYPL